MCLPSGGHAASNAIGLAGLRIASRLDHAGYLQTDRPPIGPAIRSRPAAGFAAWRPAGTRSTRERVPARTLDARRRLVRQKRLTLGRFGTFHDAFTLPASCPEGQCRLVVHDHHGRLMIARPRTPTGRWCGW